MPLADSEQPARQNRQVGWSARRLRQEPFDDPSARMKCHWQAFFELSELSAESLRQVARTRKSPWNHPQDDNTGQHPVDPQPKCAKSAVLSPETLVELHDPIL